MNMKKPISPENELVPLMAELVEPGSTDRFTCPFCKGGSKHEASLAITKFDNGNYAYHCHRASCRASGWSWLAGPLIDSLPRKQAPRPALPTFSTAPITRACMSAEMYRQLAHVSGVAYPQLPEADDEVSDRLTRWEFLSTGTFNEIAIYLRGVDGELTGLQTRRHNQHGKEVRTYKAADLVYGYYGCASFNGSIDRVWLVEDPLSALALRTIGKVSSICLCGTRVPSELIHLLRTSGSSRAILALDRDASSTALEKCWELRAESAYDILPVLLLKDVKNMSHEEIKELAKAYA